jgi:enediyne biosynthesis protein E4
MSRLLLAFAILVLGACSGAGEQARFQLLDADRTGIEFSNDVPTDDSLNVQSEVFVYNGGGVAAGDIDNDGLTDLYFTGNMVSSRLYLNKGDMRFEDITASAGVGTAAWASGAILGDVNQDGLLDLFVCVTGLRTSNGEGRANLLFLNNGNRTFTEAAARYGLADTGYSVTAAFLDYDGDGDLDLFLVNNSPKDFSRGAADAHPMGVRSDSPEGYNTLYRNDGARFTDVSREAGILRQVGHGLGVAVADVNGDGRPDIYVSNDVQPNDVLYINNGDGTFTDRAATSVKHASFAGMGIDIADINNDGWPDIAQVDMLPATLEQRKRMSGYQTYFSMVELRRRGFRVDYDANALQLNNGRAANGDPVFSDIAWMAGVGATDWSWSALFADLDNDGLKDLFVTNGYPKAPNDLDYQMIAMGARQSNRHEDALQAVRELRGYHVPNYLFRNNGDLTFSDQSHAWGLSQPGFSHGAAYADLNNDGRLDLVVNNLNAPASIYAGTAVDSAHYLQIKLEGEAPNRRAIGATIVVTAAGKRQYFYHSPYRGYLSTMDDREHVGLGRAARVDSLQVFWPDGRTELLTNIEADRMITVKQVSGVRCRGESCLPHPPAPTPPPFQQADLISYAQPRRATVDYEVQPLLPYEVSKQGPALAVADVNGDGLEDVYVGGNANAGGKLFLQQKSGRFVEAVQRTAWTTDKGFEDWGAAFVDANGDGRPDLYVASCSYQHSPASRFQQDRLYINRGNGQFARDTAALPPMPTCTASVAVGDFSGDGRPDLFVGGRLAPRSYPFPARSYLLRNEGGRFSDVTAAVAPELAQPHGMITAAVWTDYDGDGRLDLVTAGEWLGIEFWRNDGSRLAPAPAGLPPSRGWWWSLAAGDFNRDGKPDLIAGNLGLNTMLQTSPGSRFGVYAGNFAETPTTDIVLTQERDGKEYPLFGRARLGPTMYVAALRFPTYAGFANATVEQLFGAAALTRAQHYQADTFASVYLENRGDGTFTWTRLPSLAQLAPIRGIVARDVDGDGNLDAVVAGNLNDTEANIPPADAGNGLWLRGDGRGGFSPVAPRESGFLVPRNVAGLAHVQTPAGSAVIVANTGDSLQAFVIRKR